MKSFSQDLHDLLFLGECCRTCAWNRDVSSELDRARCSKCSRVDGYGPDSQYKPKLDLGLED